jgi:hypothetical protein
MTDAPPPARSTRRHGLSLRVRLVLLSTAALAIGLAIGVVALTAVLRFGLERATDLTFRTSRSRFGPPLQRGSVEV